MQVHDEPVQQAAAAPVPDAGAGVPGRHRHLRRVAGELLRGLLGSHRRCATSSDCRSARALWMGCRATPCSLSRFQNPQQQVIAGHRDLYFRQSRHHVFRSPVTFTCRLLMRADSRRHSHRRSGCRMHAGVGIDWTFASHDDEGGAAMSSIAIRVRPTLGGTRLLLKSTQTAAKSYKP